MSDPHPATPRPRKPSEDGPFLWLSNEAFDRIMRAMPGDNQRASCATVYLGLCRISSQCSNAAELSYVERDRVKVELTVEAIGEYCCLSRNTAGQALAKLKAIGLIEIEGPRTGARTYRLLSVRACANPVQALAQKLRKLGKAKTPTGLQGSLLIEETKEREEAHALEASMNGAPSPALEAKEKGKDLRPLRHLHSWQDEWRAMNPGLSQTAAAPDQGGQENGQGIY